MSVLIQLRRDTASNWSSTNPTLAQGEVGVELSTGKFKIGDGSTAWNSLAYASSGGSAGFTIATTPPSSPSAGDTYWDSEEGVAYIWYEDGSSNQWVPLVPTSSPTAATGGGTDQVFLEHSPTVTTSYTIGNGSVRNAISAGPIEIENGAVVTVPSGASWVIV